MKSNPIHQLFPMRKGNIFNAVLIVIMIMVFAQPVLAGNATPGIAPPNSNPYGKSYAQWTANWWRYVMGFPAASSPLADDTGANCANGQSGPVFFLVGTIGTQVVRNDCVVPLGKSILFPVLNAMCAIPEDGPTKDAVIEVCSRGFIDQVDLAEVTVDGVKVHNIIPEYRFAEWFPFIGAAPSIYEDYCTGAPAGTCYEGFHSQGYSDGYWIMLRPLTPGQHVIHILGGVSSWGFTVDVTYNLTVED